MTQVNICMSSDTGKTNIEIKRVDHCEPEE